MGKRNMTGASPAMRRYQSARSNLLLVLIFGAVNMVLASMGSYTYFVFSDYAAYLLALIGRELYELSGNIVYLLICLGGAVLALLPILLSWIFSKKHRGWLIVALVVLLIDTGLVVYDALSGEMIDFLVDILFHIWLVVSMILGISSGKQAMAEQEEPYAPAPRSVEEVEFHDASVVVQPNTPALGMPQEERKFRVLLSTQHGGDTIEVRRSYGLTELVVNGKLYAQREGVMEGAYTLSARVSGKLIEAKQLPGGLLTIEVDGVLVDEKLRLI